MKRILRSLAMSGVVAAGGLFATARPAAAHSEVVVNVRAPHASLTFRGGPAFPVGYVVARPYAKRVFYRRHYGYGFWSPRAHCSFHSLRHKHWIPVRRYRTGWIVVSSGHYPYRPAAGIHWRY
jgi:hypothetical protein